MNYKKVERLTDSICDLVFVGLVVLLSLNYFEIKVLDFSWMILALIGGVSLSLNFWSKYKLPNGD